MTAPHRLLIVGNGMAGARLAENVLARMSDRQFEIVVFGDEPGGTYNRILLSGVLAGTHAGPDIVTNPVEWYASNNIVLHSSTRVEYVDLDTRSVGDARGVHEHFDSLVLATGSRPVLPRIKGLVEADGSLTRGVFVFRTVEDCAQMAVAASEARRAVVIGGGLLGLEAARGLLGQGIDVTVVHLGPHLMDTQLDAAAGRILQRQIERMGIGIQVATTTTRIHADEQIREIEFGDGRRLECDLLVVAAGVRPNVDLANECGLHVNRGIIVGDDLQCAGARGVYAIGDCAEHRGEVYGLVGPAWEQADVLADRLTARREDALYRGSRPATKLKVAGLDVAVMGDRDPVDDDDVITYSEPSRGIYSRLIVRNDRIAGAILVGAASAVPSVVQRFLDRSPAPEPRSELLFPQTGEVAARPVNEIPDAARICDCNAVSKQQIVEAVLNGATSVRAVCEKTRASTGCGSCKPEVQRIVDYVCREMVDTPAPRGGGSSQHVAACTGEDHAKA
jgi:nitrite reductase (NADH) large subunit